MHCVVLGVMVRSEAGTRDEVMLSSGVLHPVQALHHGWMCAGSTKRELLKDTEM